MTLQFLFTNTLWITVTVFTGGYPPPHLLKRLLFIFSDHFQNWTDFEESVGVGVDSPQSQKFNKWPLNGYRHCNE